MIGRLEASIMNDNQAQQSFRQRANRFIFDHAREEYDYLISRLKERIEEKNANPGNLPQFVLHGSTVELGHTALYLEPDQLPTEPEVYLLTLKLGLAPFKKPLFGTGPPPQRKRLRATASADLSSVLWVNDLGEFTSDLVVEFALDLLTSYYCRHMPQPRG